MNEPRSLWIRVMTGALLLVVSVVLGYWLAFTARWFFEFLPHGGVW